MASAAAIKKEKVDYEGISFENSFSPRECRQGWRQTACNKKGYATNAKKDAYILINMHQYILMNEYEWKSSRPLKLNMNNIPSLPVYSGNLHAISVVDHRKK
jgi:hypothetical protein